MDTSIFNTDKIILFVYPVGASGKFVTNCLSFNDKFYPQLRLSIGNVQQPIGKMRLMEYGLEHYIKRKKEDPNFEWLDISFGDHEFFGCEYFDEQHRWPTVDSYKETILDLVYPQLSTLINQEIYFFKVLHHKEHCDYYSQLWPNAKIVYMINCFDWINRRPGKWKAKNQLDWPIKDNFIIFDTNSLFSWETFLVEYQKLLKAFNIEMQNVDRIEKFYHRYMYAINL